MNGNILIIFDRHNQIKTTTMSAEMRKFIDSYKGYFEKRRTMDVVISYDIKTDMGAFRADLLNYLRSVHNGIAEITESTYKISDQLNTGEIEVLTERIQKLYDDALRNLSESKVSKGTRVYLILPVENTLNIWEIINEGAA